MANTFLRNDGTFAAIAAADVGASVGFFHVNRSSGTNQTVTATVITKIQFNNKVSDPSGWFDAVTNFRFNPQAAGTWLIILKLGTPATASDGAIALIEKNGASVAQGSYATSAATSGSIAVALVTFNGSTDYVEGFGYSPNTTFTGQNDLTYMQGIKLA